MNRAALALLLLACEAAPAAPDAGAADASVGSPVEVITLTAGPIADGIEGTATVEARVRATVRAQVAGVLSGLELEEGDPVTADKLLATVTRPALAGVVAQAEASLKKAKHDLTTARDLQKRGLVPQQQVDDARFAAEQAELEVSRLRDERGLGRVTAPITGVVVTRHVQPGEAVSAGAPLLDLADLSELFADVRVPERLLPRLQPGLPVEVTAEGLGAAEVVGKVERVAPTVDARSGTVKVTIGLGEGRVTGSDQRLRPGMYVQARIIVDRHPDAVLVPKRALVRQENQAYVFRVVGDTAQRILLDAGYQDRTNIEARSALAAGDTVVVFGQRGLKDGAKVRVVEAPPAGRGEDG